MEGGYLMIDLARSDLFNRLLIGIDLGKPILLRDGKQNYFIDKITGGNVTAYEDDGITPSTYADIVLTSAIGTITIKQNGTITKASNPDTSELNAIKDYVDDLKELIEINEGDLTLNGDVTIPNINRVSKIEFDDNSSMTTAPHLYEYIFSADCNDNKSWYFRCLTTENVNNLIDLLELLNEQTKVIYIIGENEDHNVKPINNMYYNDDQKTEIYMDELFDNEQNIGFLVADAHYQAKKQIF